MDIVKALIPAAGLGTRFLPFTKSIPKEMLPLMAKPAIQYIIEEGLLSELSQFLIITSRDKYALSDHFDSSPELQALLKEKGKESLLASVEKIIRQAHFTYIRQPEPLGLGHAVWMARHAIGKEYFAIFLPDDIITGSTPGIAQLMTIARQEKASVIAVQEVPSECISSYGVIAIKKAITPNLFQVSQVIEKPHPKDAPSSLAIVGRYVLSSKIMGTIDEMMAYDQENISLTDAITQLMHGGERVFAYKVQGTRYDIGSHLGWVKAVVATSLQDPELGPALKKFLADVDTPESFLYNPAKMIQDNL